jgi:hypothetical protein
MDEHLENRLRFLRKANTEGMPHSDRGLLDHLLGTRQLLVEWEARPARNVTSYDRVVKSLVNASGALEAGELFPSPAV